MMDTRIKTQLGNLVDGKLMPPPLLCGPLQTLFISASTRTEQGRPFVYEKDHHEQVKYSSNPAVIIIDCTTL